MQEYEIEVDELLGIGAQAVEKRYSEAELLDLPCYIFSADAEIDVRRRGLPWSIIPRGKLRLICSQRYQDLPTSNELDHPEPGERFIQSFTRHAAYIASELEEVYRLRGVRTIRSICGLPAEIVKHIQIILLPTLPETTNQLTTELQSLALERLSRQKEFFAKLQERHLGSLARLPQWKGSLFELVEKARLEMLKTAQDGLRFQRKYISESIAERAKALKSGIGKADFDERDLVYFKLLGKTPPNSEELQQEQRDMISQLANKVQTNSSIPPDQVGAIVVQTIKALQQAGLLVGASQEEFEEIEEQVPKNGRSKA